MGNTHGFVVPRRQRPQMMASWELKDHESSRSHGTEVHALTRFLLGDNLETIIDLSARYGKLGGSSSGSSVELYTNPMIRSCHVLMGSHPHEDYSSARRLRRHQHRHHNRHMNPHESLLSTELWNLFFQVFVSVYMGDYESADAFVSEMKKRRSRRTYCSVPLVIENHMIFYEGIIAAVLAEPSRAHGDSKYRRRKLGVAQRKLHRLRTERVDEDPALWNKVFLLEAQIHSSIGQYEKALLLFHKSIELAEQERFPHEQGLAYELAGVMCHECGCRGNDDNGSDDEEDRELQADLFIAQAQACYGRWGAIAKAELLDQGVAMLLGHSNTNHSHHSRDSSRSHNSSARSQSSSRSQHSTLIP